MKPRIYEISDMHTCDCCNEYTQLQVQTEELEWICPVCEKTQSCYECGAITCDVRDYKGHLTCPDCIYDLEITNPNSSQNVIDIQKFAASLLGY